VSASPPSQPKRLSPLFRAAALGGVKAAVLAHIRRGDDVNAIDDKGRTPLILAASRGHTEVCQMLIEAGSNSRVIDREGKDALTVAIDTGRPYLVEMLRQALVAAAATDDAHLNTAPRDSLTNDKANERDRDNATSDSDAPDTMAVEPCVGDNIIDNETLDISGWEEEVDSQRPENDPSLAEAALSLQQSVSHHVLIDHDEDWSDIEIDLPDFDHWRRPRIRDEEHRSAIRNLIVCGLRDGCLPLKAIQDVTEPDDEADGNVDTTLNLRNVLGDLGIHIDDGVWAPISEHADEANVYDADEDIADEAVQYHEILSSGNSTPFVMYTNELSAFGRLTREDEEELGRQMDEGFTQILINISRSVSALREIVRVGRSVVNGGVSPDSMIITAAESGEEVDESNDDNVIIINRPESNYVVLNLSAQLDEVQAHIDNLIAGGATCSSSKDISAKIGEIGMSRAFIERLLSVVAAAPHEIDIYQAMSLGLRKIQHARQKLTECNLALVVWHARKYNFGGLPLDDLVQEGNIGLMKAAERFDYRRGAKFSSFATWWILQGIKRAVGDKGRTIRVPTNLLNTVFKVHRLQATVSPITGQPITPDQIADSLSIPSNTVNRILQIPNEPISVDSNTVDGYPISETVVDEMVQNPEESVAYSRIRVVIEKALLGLKPIQSEVIRMRFGINMDSEYTLEEIGQRYGVTRERIRQIEAKSIKRLIYPLRKYESYL
jgi:RNA polymerase primary sigma factor